MSASKRFLSGLSAVSVDARDVHGKVVPVERSAGGVMFRHSVATLARHAKVMIAGAALAASNVALATADQPVEGKALEAVVLSSVNEEVRSKIEFVSGGRSPSAMHTYVKCVVDMSGLDYVAQVAQSKGERIVDMVAFRKLIARHEAAHCEAVDSSLKPGVMQDVASLVREAVKEAGFTQRPDQPVETLVLERQADLKAVFLEAREQFSQAITPADFEQARQKFSENVEQLMALRRAEAALAANNPMNFNDHDTLYVVLDAAAMINAVATSRFPWWKFERAHLGKDGGLGYAARLATASVVRELPYLKRKFEDIELSLAQVELIGQKYELDRLSKEYELQAKGPDAGSDQLPQDIVEANRLAMQEYLSDLKERIAAQKGRVEKVGLTLEALRSEVAKPVAALNLSALPSGLASFAQENDAHLSRMQEIARNAQDSEDEQQTYARQR